MNATLKMIVTGAFILTGATIVNAQAVGETVLGVEVNVAKVVTEGYSANQLIGANVHNGQDKSVGYVHDLILAPSGEISLAIVEVGGFLGLGSKWVAVPADMFEPGHQANIVILPQATEEELKKIPPFKYKS
ncbi:PRC-barrel domain-containing protein [Ruegeria sp. R14_0]|uniref:PRC-barrel domain-containing protein n=1 Tax=Ruegeria sp. R14_0 TaxID=2821100 RepID=UPI001ADB29CF|nr:PRC-barrel domain-containing protein [Ruegeria sp. R14_0]MBO9448214.1 PRC-barrel domain-containing protein [Ruegeria sp. R14_0]